MAFRGGGVISTKGKVIFDMFRRTVLGTIDGLGSRV